MPRSLSTDARDRMLAAAVEVVLDIGVARFSVDEVARRSGVAKTTIYRHFPNGKAMLVAALDRTLTPPPTPDTGSLRGDVVAYLESVRPLFGDTTLRTLFFEIVVAGWRDPELGDLSQSLLRARTGPTRAIYDNARRREELAAGIDYPTLLEIVQGPFVMRGLTRPTAVATADLDELADRIVLLLSPTASMARSNVS
jgi:AcrR family transcriptional regulator